MDSIIINTQSVNADSLEVDTLTAFTPVKDTLSAVAPLFPSVEALKQARYDGIRLEQVTDQNNWVSGIILFVLLLFWAVWRFAGQFFAIRSTGVVSVVGRKALFGDDTAKSFTSDVVFSLIHLMVLGLFIYQVLYYIGVKSGIPLFFYCILGLLTVHIIKYGLNKLFTYVFFDSQMYNEWKQSYNFNNYLLGILFIPLVLGMVYGTERIFEICLASGFFIFIILLFFYAYRLFIIFFNNVASLLYLILYLCALEIVPLMIGYKLVFVS